MFPASARPFGYPRGVLRGARRTALAVLLRVLTALGCHRRAAAVAYRSRARRLAEGTHAHIRRWGVSFDLNLNDNVQRHFYYTGWYEREFLEFLQDELRADDTYGLLKRTHAVSVL